jgi:hypothetical protein
MLSRLNHVLAAQSSPSRPRWRYMAVSAASAWALLAAPQLCVAADHDNRSTNTVSEAKGLATSHAGLPVNVPVIAVSTLTTTIFVSEPACYPVLITVREYELAQANARPWFVRHIEGLAGAPLGAAGALWLAAHYLPGRIWILPAALAGAAAGWVTGPLGIVLGAGGSLLGHALTHKAWGTAAGGMAGGLMGMALWHLLIPPPKPTTPASPLDIPVEHFVTNHSCSEVQHARLRGGDLYKVDFVLDGRLMSANLPYDPGKTLEVYPDGQPVKLMPTP